MSRPDPKELGRRGEVFALGWLSGRGYQVLERNWRCSLGELDLVATDGGDVVAVEVKTRSSRAFGDPAEAVGTQKLARLHRLLHAWCRARSVNGIGRRVDVLAVLWAHGESLPQHVDLYRAVMP